MKILLALFLLTGSAFAQCGPYARLGILPGGVRTCIPKGPSAGNVFASSGGAVTSLAIDLTPLQLATTSGLLVQCWSGTTTLSQVSITSLTSVSTSAVTANFSSTANVGCRANATGAGPTGAAGSAGATGPAGANGTNGTNGTNGLNGAGNNAYCADATGSTTTYTCPTPSPAVVSLTGLLIAFVPQTNSSSGTSTLNVAGLGAKTLKMSDGTTNMTSLVGGKSYLVAFDGTNLRQVSAESTGNATPALTTVSFSATPVFPISNTTQGFTITLTGNVTSSTFSGTPTDGQEVWMRVCEDATGGRTFVFPVSVVAAGAIDTAANACTYQLLKYLAGSTAYVVIAQPKSDNTATAALISSNGTYPLPASSGDNTLQTLGAAQTVSGSKTYTGVVDSHGASKTLPHRSGTGSPVARDACATVGETYFQTDATAGSNTFACTATGTPGTWTLQGGAGGGSCTFSGLWSPWPAQQSAGSAVSALTVDGGVVWLLPPTPCTLNFHFFDFQETSAGNYLILGIWSNDRTTLLCGTAAITGSAIKSAAVSTGANNTAGLCSLPPSSAGYWFAIAGDSNSSGMISIQFNFGQYVNQHVNYVATAPSLATGSTTALAWVADISGKTFSALSASNTVPIIWFEN